MCKYSHYFNSREMMRRFFIVNHDNYDSRTDFNTLPCIYCEYGTVIKGHTPTSGSNVEVIVGNPQAAATLTELRFHSPGLRAKHATLGKHAH